MRILAVDYGARRIGVAVSDELEISARGVTTLKGLGLRTAVERIAGLVSELGVAMVVVGVPLRSDRTAGDAADRVMRFVEKLRLALDVPVSTVDERLTSFEAELRMREMGLSAVERKRRIDEVAAVVILEEFMAGRANARGRTTDG